jgi:hypothetical protein
MAGDLLAIRDNRETHMGSDLLATLTVGRVCCWLGAHLLCEAILTPRARTLCAAGHLFPFTRR